MENALKEPRSNFFVPQDLIRIFKEEMHKFSVEVKGHNLLTCFLQAQPKAASVVTS